MQCRRLQSSHSQLLESLCSASNVQRPWHTYMFRHASGRLSSEAMSKTVGKAKKNDIFDDSKSFVPAQQFLALRVVGCTTRFMIYVL